MEVTHKCNSRCIHCYEGAKHYEVDNPLSLTEWKRVISDISLVGCKRVQFIGGEPTIYPDLPELIIYAKKCGINTISLFSNLFNISNELLESIRCANVSVHFSIYGATAKTHDSITQINGSFAKVMASIGLLKPIAKSLTAHIVVMRENEDERENIYSLLQNLQISDVKYDEIRKVHANCQEKHLVRSSKVLMTKPNFRASSSYFNNSNYHNTCWYGKCVISTDGNIYPCEFERNVIYGNIRNNEIFEILNSEGLNKYWEWSFDKVESCKDCEYRFACKDCRPLAYAENSQMSTKNPRCKYNPYNGVWEE